MYNKKKEYMYTSSDKLGINFSRRGGMQRGGAVAHALAPGPLPLAPAAWVDGGWPRDRPCNALSPEGPSCDWLLQKGPASDALLPGAANAAATDAATDAADATGTDAAIDVPRSSFQDLQPQLQPPAALLRQPQPPPPDDSSSRAAAEPTAAALQAVEAERASLSAYRAHLLREGVTYNLSAVAPLPQLPVLRANNTRQFPEWHRYARRLYGARGVARALPLDLNEFSWFYWFAPLRLRSLYLCDWEDHYPQVRVRVAVFRRGFSQACPSQSPSRTHP